MNTRRASRTTAATAAAAPVKDTGRAKRTATTAAKRKAAPPSDVEDEVSQDESDVDEKPVAKKAKTTSTKAAPTKRRTKADKSSDAAPLAARTAISTLKTPMYIGAHVSAAGGVHNTIPNALRIGANSLALFLKSQRKWTSPPMDPTAKSSFRSLSKEHAFSPTQHMLPHGSYLVNLAQPDAAKAAQAYGAFVDDLRRCAQLGIKLYNFHPGSAVGEGATKAEACKRIAAQLNKAHKETEEDCTVGENGEGVEGGVVTVLENMAGSGNVIGSRFEELRDIIALVENKDRVGVCIDTCHAFAAGYDFRTPDTFAAMMKEFDDVVGLKYLKALHLNDSKAPLGSNRDLHANIGTGYLGLRAFHAVMNYAPFAGMPMVLETPIDHKGPDGKSVEDFQIWADEIKLLEGLIGADTETDEFSETEKKLQAKGKAERDRVAAQVEKKGAKGKGSAGKGKGRGKKKECDSCDEGESD